MTVAQNLDGAIAVVPNLTGEQIAKLSDKELHERCQNCGLNIRKLQKEFAFYLPEVERRNLHKKHDFHSIYDYAGRIAGMNHATVDSIMSVHKKLIGKPILRDMMGEFGWGKLKVVAAVATPETQEFWAEKIKEMSKATLMTFMREVRKQNGGEICVQSNRPRGGEAGFPMDEKTGTPVRDVQIGLFTNSENAPELGTGSGKPIAGSQKSTFAFKLDDETETELRIFKQRLEKQTREPQDWNKVMSELLKIAEQHGNCAQKGQREVQPAAKKAEPVMSEEIKKSLPAASTRHIPARVKKYLQQKYGGKCAFPGCKNPAEINHHVKRFVLESRHDPDSIVPLCKNHERIAHHGLIKNEEQMPENWKVQLEPDDNSPKSVIDKKVQQYRLPVRAG